MTFHHIGVACTDFESEARKLVALGYTVETPVYLDPIQGVRVQFLTGPGPRLELIVPEGEAGVLDPWLATGTKLYHLAWETSDIEEALMHLRSSRGKVVVPPVSAVAFDGRQIAFVLLPNMMLVELISTKPRDEEHLAAVAPDSA
jgi:methylmalonyl-CoA/ethylmalonyl-CoA epimerase